MQKTLYFKTNMSWWYLRSRLEKSCLIAIFIMSLVLLTMSLIITTWRSTNCPKNEELCTTSECLQAANNILESLDYTVDPCANFYHFSCGSRIKKMVLATDKLYIDQFGIIRDQIMNQLRTLLEEPTKIDEIKPISQVKTYYKACMNEDIIEKHGQQIFADLIAKLGGWPVLEGDIWPEEKFHWTKLIYKFRKIGLETNMFIEMTVDPDPTNSSVRIVELDQAILSLHRELLLSSLKNVPYLGLMINISIYLGADKFRAEKEMNEALQFELQLANISLASVDRRNISQIINHMTINELQAKYPNTPWLEYINTLLPKGIQLKNIDKILVVVPTYFSSLEFLFSQTPKRVQANYAIWRILKDLTSFMPQAMYKHVLYAGKIIDGYAERPLRWKECIQGTTSNLPLLTSSLYIRNYFDEEAKTGAVEIAAYIRSAFQAILKSSKWMDSATRKKALQKSERMTECIGYPQQLLDNALLETYYENLEIDEFEYLKSYLNIRVHKLNTDYRRLFEPVNKADWTEYGNTATVGAFYTPQRNNIFFPAGILQGTFFNKHRPRYLNFGGIGAIIGHEITHGFDDSGRQFDSEANLLNWWVTETEKSFLNKTQCMVYQYGNYTIPEINKTINGLKTVSENIADNGGIKQAYLAYTTWVGANGIEKKLPGLNFSQNQLFWISAALNWCTKYNVQHLENAVRTDSHAPNEFRVLGPFSNSEAFASDFNCPVGSKMNPKFKCEVW